MLWLDTYIQLWKQNLMEQGSTRFCMDVYPKIVGKEFLHFKKRKCSLVFFYISIYLKYCYAKLLSIDYNFVFNT